MKKLMPLLALLLATMWLTVLAAPTRGQEAPVEIRPGLMLYPNTNPNPLPCPPEPVLDPDRDLVATWGPEVPLTTVHKLSNVPRIAASGNAVYVVWDTSNLPEEIRSICLTSLNRGETWGSYSFLGTRQIPDALTPAVSAWGSRVQGVFQKQVNGNVTASLSLSLDYGQTWSYPVEDLIPQGWHPAVSCWGNYVNAIAQNNYPLLIHRFSSDGGVSFQPADTIASFYLGGWVARLARQAGCIIK